MQMNKYDDTPVKIMLYPALCFMIIGMTIGVFMAFNAFLFPDYFAGEYIHFGRIRPVHVWNVLFLWLVSANLGLFYFLVPRLCGAPLWSPKVAYVSAALWWSGLIIASYAYPAGYNTGWEYAEITDFVGWIPVKYMVYIGWALFALNILMTIANRKYEKMYVSLWYSMGVTIWASFTIMVGFFAIRWVPEGISRVNTSFFYIHNLVGLIFTPMGLATTYYFLPKLSNRPIYSHSLSMVGFWSIAFTYAWIGAHHIIHGPVSQWLQTTSIVFSMWLFIPVWTVVTNFFATLTGHWNKYSESVPIRFLIAGTLFYLITCVQGPLMALRNINEITSKTDWIIGHSHISLYATFTFFAFGAVYYVIPIISKKPLWSQRLSEWHFALNMWGTIPFILSIWLGGFIQGMLWANWSEGNSYAEYHNRLAHLSFVDTIVDMRPWWTLRAIGGLIILFGNILFVVNVFNTVVLRERAPRQNELQAIS